jgi:hypothetical protein
MRYVLEPVRVPGEWMVTVPDPEAAAGIVFEGSAQDCIDWCQMQGAKRIGPRVFVTAD